ncbi:hypothetical protein GLAREA_06623 [Glarea lozoyensis ATCC 20868]|uniref:Uncharacterized protein n=1 Tax=Glarea lozoyensis (strain ATCC 20868 / MF5171) TaxID=1116229 RepID=S3D732_GLAL2|nr:uncharacterized protein GLAREA_06623 [Glarea lozoyensis ATCC 20868]EPE33610.1 hypothetical protein GLAREA_06623 [Glarea lozoyensis ATCC 20868]
MEINGSNITPTTASRPVTEHSFLTSFPYEIRRFIYGHLLTTPLLAEWDCLGGRKSRKTPGKPSEISYTPLGLGTSIMRTNRQIWEESEDVLYGQNVFMVTFPRTGYVFEKSNLLKYRAHRVPLRGFMCSLTRYNQIIDDEKCVMDDGDLLEPGFEETLTKIRRWKLMLPSDKEIYQVGVGPFCHLIRHSTLVSLDVTFKDVWYHRMIGEVNLETLLNCITTLRLRGPARKFSMKFPKPNLLKIERLQREHIPGYWWDLPKSSHEEIRKQRTASLASLESKIAKIVYGETKPESTIEMYYCLKRYYQAFYRHTSFDGHFQRSLDSWSSSLASKGQALPEGWFEWEWIHHSSVQCHGHDRATKPSEWLYHASTTASELDPKQFKHRRQCCLTFLEDTYKDILARRDRLTDVIKGHKTLNGILAPFQDSISEGGTLKIQERTSMLFQEGTYSDELIAELLDPLEGYASKLRDACRTTASPEDLDIKNFQDRKPGAPYGPLSSDKFAESITWALENENFDIFCSNYKAAVDDLDQQCLEIRNARKCLFEHDLTDRECDIDLELSRCDDMIDWDVVEPDLCPQRDVIGARDQTLTNRPYRVDVGPSWPCETDARDAVEWIQPQAYVLTNLSNKKKGKKGKKNKSKKEAVPEDL